MADSGSTRRGARPGPPERAPSKKRSSPSLSCSHDRAPASRAAQAPHHPHLRRGPRQSYSLAGVALSILVTVLTIIVGELVLSGRGQATLGAGGIADVLWRNLAVAALLGPLGVCVGALVRNQIVTVVGLVIMAAALEPAVFQAVPEVGRFLPLAGAPGGVLGGTHGLLAPGPALAVMVAWTLTIFAAAAWRLRGRDLV
jgi:hypothetical protein